MVLMLHVDVDQEANYDWGGKITGGSITSLVEDNRTDCTN